MILLCSEFVRPVLSASFVLGEEARQDSGGINNRVAHAFAILINAAQAEIKSSQAFNHARVPSSVSVTKK